MVCCCASWRVGDKVLLAVLIAAFVLSGVLFRTVLKPALRQHRLYGVGGEDRPEGEHRWRHGGEQGVNRGPTEEECDEVDCEVKGIDDDGSGHEVECKKNALGEWCDARRLGSGTGPTPRRRGSRGPHRDRSGSQEDRLSSHEKLMSPEDMSMSSGDALEGPRRFLKAKPIATAHADVAPGDPILSLEKNRVAPAGMDFALEKKSISPEDKGIPPEEVGPALKEIGAVGSLMDKRIHEMMKKISLPQSEMSGSPPEGMSGPRQPQEGRRRMMKCMRMWVTLHPNSEKSKCAFAHVNFTDASNFPECSFSSCESNNTVNHEKLEAARKYWESQQHKSTRCLINRKNSSQVIIMKNRMHMEGILGSAGLHLTFWTFLIGVVCSVVLIVRRCTVKKQVSTEVMSEKEKEALGMSPPALAVPHTQRPGILMMVPPTYDDIRNAKPVAVVPGPPAYVSTVSLTGGNRESPMPPAE